MSITKCWTRLTTTTFSLVAWETYAFSCIAIACTFICTFSILVLYSIPVRAVNPGQFKWTNTLGTVSSFKTSHSPTRITCTLILWNEEDEEEDGRIRNENNE
jgi:hypothetical protein